MHESRNLNIEDTGKLMTQPEGPDRKKVIIIAAVALIAVILIGVLGIKALGEKRYNDQIAIAEKAMQEGNYEQAETAYLKAVGMNKRKPKAREGLAYVYAIQSKFEDAEREYQSLYDDTGEEKYMRAVEEVTEGRVPTDSSLVVATAWREIPLSDAPYPDALERFVMTTAWFPDSGYYYSADAVPDADVLLEMVDRMAGGDGDLMTPADEIKADEYNQSQWDLYLNDYYELGEGTQPWEPDPRGLFEEGYYVSEQEALEKYLRDIYNFSDETIEAVRAGDERYDSYYLQDGYYYKFYPIGGDATDYQVNTVWTNGAKYCVKYDSIFFGWNDDGSDYVDNYYELLELKTIDGRPYWTMSYNGREMPEEVVFGPVGEEGGSSEAYTAYADVLRENESEIKYYWWQLDEYGDMYNEYNDTYDGAAGDLVNPCVALYDLNGDGTEELLFFSAEQNYEASLHIFTYSDGRAVECDCLTTGYDNERGEFTDVAVAGGTRYVIYAGNEAGTFYLARVISDEWAIYTVSKMSMSGESDITESQQVRFGQGPNDDYSAEITEYSIDGKNVGESKGAKALEDICSDRGKAIMWSDPDDLSNIVQIDTSDPIAMTYDEAIAKLSR